LTPKKFVTKLSEIWVWDPGCGKNSSRIQVSKKHRIPEPDPQHCIHVGFCVSLKLFIEKRIIFDLLPIIIIHFIFGFEQKSILFWKTISEISFGTGYGKIYGSNPMWIRNPVALLGDDGIQLVLTASVAEP
jgi:hypothetical protein